MDDRINVLLALMIIASFLVAIILHEFAHALMAYLLGDRTPLSEGRLTFRLPSHIDSVGLLLCVILAFQPIFTPPTGLGWGKPVKPDPWKLRTGPNSGVLLVALAGPLFNLLVGLLTALLIYFVAPFLFGFHNVLTTLLLQLLAVFAVVNVCLTIFNVLPFYPLDGYQIVYTLLPSKQAVQFGRSATYGPFIILILFFFLPFLAQLSRVGSFPLFQLPHYIWLGAVNILAPICALERLDKGFLDNVNALVNFYAL